MIGEHVTRLAVGSLGDQYVTLVWFRSLGLVLVPCAVVTCIQDVFPAMKQEHVGACDVPGIENSDAGIGADIDLLLAADLHEVTRDGRAYHGIMLERGREVISVCM